MRVLRVSHSAAVDQWRGRERALTALGVDVRLLSARRSFEGAGVIELVRREDEAVTGVRTLGRHPALFLYDPRPIWRALGEPVDVIDIHEEPFALATAEVLLLRRLRGNGAPVVLYTAQNILKRYPVPFRWLERWALKSASGVSACNTDAVEIVAAKGFAGRARVVPLGIDPHDFRPRSDPRTHAEDTSVVGFIGRLVPEKGVRVLLEALGYDQGLRARFAGTGPLAATLLETATELDVHDRVELVGAVAPEHAADFYSSLDVLAVPSLSTPRWTEQFGRVAVEAMACGVPVVASDAGALPDVVAGAGIVVPEGDAGALATALRAAAGPRRDELRAAGLLRVEECTWNAVARDYLALYRSVLHEAHEMPTRPLEIIVVAFGSPGLLRKALEPVRDQDVTVVDNSSMPEIEALCVELGVRYLNARGNLGFGAGVNFGLAHRRSPDSDVLLLNPDARIEPESVRRLQDHLRSAPDIASVAPMQVDENDRPARVEWPFPSPANAWLESLGLGRWQRGAAYAIGAVLLLRAEALDQVGGFDERFFLYAEETDWAYRAHRLGWQHALVTDAAAVHVGAGTSTDGRVRDTHFHASQERYYRKHHGALGWSAARAAVWLGSMMRSVLLPGDRGRAARRRAALYRLGPVRIESRLRAAP